MQVLFDSNAMVTLKRQERQKIFVDEVFPTRWHLAIAEAVEKITGRSVRQASASDLFVRDRVGFFWHPSLTAAFLSLTGPSIFLCWGAMRARGMSAVLQRALFKFSDKLLVNEHVTKQEILDLSSRNATIIPMFVDTQFFIDSSEIRREDFFFCNGSNGRDPDLLLKLARTGHKIVWLCNSPDLVDRFGAASKNLTVISNVSYAQLLELYQKCRAVLMPSKNDFHAAGQTTGLEALACGAPLISSFNRSSTIFLDQKSVFVLRDNNFEKWDEVLRTFKPSEEERAAASSWVASHCSKGSLEQQIRAIFAELT